MSLLATIIGALLAGALFGAIPFFLGKKFNKEQLGFIGFIACIICNFFLGIFLSIPCCIIFSAIILLKK